MTLSLEARSLAFNNVAHVGPEFARTKTEGWAAASEAFRAQHPKHLDLAYARGDRTKWDLYPAPDPNAPCYIHIHGGYWQRGGKEIFACMAEGVLARGWSAALPGSTLAPDASLTQMIASSRDFHAYRAQAHLSGSLIPVGNTNHFTILDQLRLPDRGLTRAVLQLAET